MNIILCQDVEKHLQYYPNMTLQTDQTCALAVWLPGSSNYFQDIFAQTFFGQLSLSLSVMPTKIIKFTICKDLRYYLQLRQI